MHILTAMITLAIANHKGGAGKTTTAHNLGVILAETTRVLLVDLDPQATLSKSAGVIDPQYTLADVLGSTQPGKVAAAAALVELTPNLAILPSSLDLAVTELGLGTRYAREMILRAALAPIAERFDVCLIDCPPSLGQLTINGLAMASGVIAPTQPQPSDLHGLKSFLEIIDQLRGALNPGLQLAGVLICQYDGRTRLHKDAVQVIREALPTFETIIGNSIAVAEAPGVGQAVVTYQPRNPQSENYRQFAGEVTAWLKNQT